MSLRIRRMKNGDIATNGLNVDGNSAIIHANQGDVSIVKIDLADYLATGDTISGVAVSGNLTASAPTISAGVITTSITSPSGCAYADFTATLSTGEKITQRITAKERGSPIIKDYAA